MSSSDPTGRRLRIASGTTRAEIAQVGAALRAFQVDGVDLVPRYADDVPTPAASGIVLVPWPNRVRDGRWSDGRETYQLAITEPKYHNASHGLLRFVAYEEGEATTDAVTLRAKVFPQTGYPFLLDTSVTYTVGENALEVRHEVTNSGRVAAPVALGTHPYFCIAGVATADLVVRSSGATRFVVDERMLPTAQVPVDGATDLRDGRRLDDVDLDTAYGDLVRDADGLVRTTLTAPDRRSVTVWQGEGFDYVQVFTTDRFPGQPLAVAIEPMTAPADALNSGDHLRLLAPGESWTLQWGVTYSG